MANNFKYFIGNWKMFGLPVSKNILTQIDDFIKADTKFNSKYKVYITPPFTLIESYSSFFKNKTIKIGAQNLYHKDNFGSNTGSVSAQMLRAVGSDLVLVGHSDNRAEGDTNEMLKQKIQSALNNDMQVTFCIGESKEEKVKGNTFPFLKSQLTSVLNSEFNKIEDSLIVAYEPIWSIGTGMIPSSEELTKTIKYIKEVLNEIFGKTSNIKVLYGGSVDSSNINDLKIISEIDGFLIGGASRKEKNFIDIINKYFR